MPLLSTKTFHSLRLLNTSSSVSAITITSSAYNNFHGKATVNYAEKASWPSQIAKNLMLNVFAYWPLPQNNYCYDKLFVQLLLYQHTHIITCVGTLPKGFSKSINSKYTFFPLPLNFSCICLTIKIASLVPSPFLNQNHMIYINVLPNSVFEDPLNYFHSLF